MLDWPAFAALSQIVLIDVALAGDNAIAVGMAAAGLPSRERKTAIVAGIVAAAVLRAALAVFAVQLLGITGLLAAGGLLLLWVSWKMYRDISHMGKVHAHAEGGHGEGAEGGSGASRSQAKTLRGAIWQIVFADISMSLDNVLAVAGVARDHIVVLIIGLGLSVVLMGVAASWIARLTTRYHWIAYLGLITVLYTALHMIWDGAHDLMKAAGA